MVAMFKAWVTERARDVTRWGREILGGNGITHDRFIMKAVTDVEALYTL
jgi:alkylation response protein AidB-like acyl-CoA dehydrogenase